MKPIPHSVNLELARTFQTSSKKNDPQGAIRAALDHGINLIDTAPMYGCGHSEELVGKAMQGLRDKVVLATKCGLVWYKQEGEKFFDANEQGAAENDAEKQYEVYINLRPAMIRHEIEESLRRLKTDRIDLYQTHWQDSTTKTEDAMAELLRLFLASITGSCHPPINAPGIPVQADRPTGPHGETGFGLVYPSLRIFWNSTRSASC
jgi:aryl-alcohol dehydrogenase-like predicted oxidoreductase